MLGIGVSLRHLRGTTAAVDAYKVAGFKPDLVFDFEQEYYRTGGTQTTFDSAVVFGRISNATYVDDTGTIQIAAPGVARLGHHFWNGSAWEKGALFEPTGAVQLLHTTDTLVTQSHTVTAEPHTLHFTGTGTVTLSGAYSGSLVGTGTGEENRVSLTFTPTAASLTLTVSGTVSDAQLEVGSVPTSYIPNLAASGTVTRAADTLTVPSANLPWPTSNVIGPELVTNGTFDTDSDWTKGTGWSISGGAANAVAGASSGLSQSIGQQAGKVYQITFTVSNRTAGFVLLTGPFTGSSRSTNGTFTQVIVAANGVGDLAITKDTSFDGTIDNISVREIDPLAVSIQMQGKMTYADTGSFDPYFWRWYLNTSNYLQVALDHSGVKTGTPQFFQNAAGTLDQVGGGSYSPGINVPFNIASRHGSTFINGAVDGTALTANTTPTALPDLSTTDLNLAYGGGPMILKRVRIWADDLGDSGIAEASA